MMNVSKQHMHFWRQFRSIVASILQQKEIHSIFRVIHMLEHIRKGTLHATGIQMSVDE